MSTVERLDFFTASRDKSLCLLSLHITTPESVQMSFKDRFKTWPPRSCHSHSRQYSTRRNCGGSVPCVAGFEAVLCSKPVEDWDFPRMMAWLRLSACSASCIPPKHCLNSVYAAWGSSWWPCTRWDTGWWAEAGRPDPGSRPGFGCCSRAAVGHGDRLAPTGTGSLRIWNFSGSRWWSERSRCPLQCRTEGTPAPTVGRSSPGPLGKLRRQRTNIGQLLALATICFVAYFHDSHTPPPAKGVTPPWCHPFISQKEVRLNCARWLKSWWLHYIDNIMDVCVLHYKDDYRDVIAGRSRSCWIYLLQYSKLKD